MNKNHNQRSYIVEMWNRIFIILSYISLFYLIRKGAKLFKIKLSYRFVDSWVLFNFIFAISASVYVFYFGELVPIITKVLAIYGFARVFEVLVYQIDMIFFHPYRAYKSGKNYKVKSIRRTIILLIHNYIEIMFWFATIMLAITVVMGMETTVSWSEYVISTVLCITVFDHSGLESIIKPTNSVVTQVVFLEVIAGMIMTIISLARFIGMLPEVKQMEE